MGILFANGSVIKKMTLSFFDQHLIIEADSLEAVDARLRSHTDLGIYSADIIVVTSETYERVRSVLSHHYTQDLLSQFLKLGQSVLSQQYPGDICFNALAMRNHFFHLLTHSDPVVLENEPRKKVHVKQGYTRCTSLPVGADAVITEDASLAQCYEAHGYHTLLIQPGFVHLEGFPHGFIGGAGGTVDQSVVLNGSLSSHPNKEEMRAFITRQGYQIVELHQGELEDCGSILYYDTRKIHQASS